MEVLLILVDISAFQHGLVQKGTLKCLNSVRALKMRQDKPYLLAMKEKEKMQKWPFYAFNCSG